MVSIILIAHSGDTTYRSGKQFNIRAGAKPIKDKHTKRVYLYY